MTLQKSTINNLVAWHCIGHKPTVWGFGAKQDDGVLYPVLGSIKRQADGSWNWRVSGDHFFGDHFFGDHFFGNEPSSETAMKQVEDALKTSQCIEAMKQALVEYFGNSKDDIAEVVNVLEQLFPEKDLT